MSKGNIPAPIFNEFTLESIQQLLGSKAITQNIVDKINTLACNEELSETYKENLVSFTTVLTKGTFSPDQYVSAVQYVSYRLMGHKIVEAWQKTFPDRYRTLLNKGATSKEVSSHASAYNQTKLVNLVMEQSLIPSYIINNHYFQEALQVQVSLMRDKDISPKVRSDAAAKVLEYTVMPDALIANKEEISNKSLDIIAQLAASVNALADSKRNAVIEGRATTKQIANNPIYLEDVDTDGY